MSSDLVPVRRDDLLALYEGYGDDAAIGGVEMLGRIQDVLGIQVNAEPMDARTADFLTKAWYGVTDESKHARGFVDESE